MTLADECIFCLPHNFWIYWLSHIAFQGKYERLETVIDKNPYKISGKNL